VNTDDLEQYEAERELQLANEYQDVVGMFKFAVETDRRFYLANSVDVRVLSEGPRPLLEITLSPTHGYGTCTARLASCRRCAC